MLSSLLNRKKDLLLKGKKKNAFTMIELIIVIVIIAVLVAVAMPDFVSTIFSSKVTSAESNIKVIGDATLKYYTEMGQLPEASSISDLKEILIKKEDRDGMTYGPWMKNNMSVTDPWGHPYQYIPDDDGMNFDIVSQGPYGKNAPIKYSNLGNHKK